MGAQTFLIAGCGVSLSAALEDAKTMTRALTGHSDTLYGGTVLGKDWAREVCLPADVPPNRRAITMWVVRLLHPDDYALPLDQGLGWIADKSGPAGAVKLDVDAMTGDTTWLFFGWAAC